MEPIDKDGKDKFILTGNSGEVYYKKEDISAENANGSALGDYECKKCFVKKPFENVRWNSDHKLFVCLDCLAKEDAARK